jgi:flagellin
MLTVANAQTASDAVETAVIAINTARSTIGAALSRLDVAASNLAASIENTESARSTLLDTDVSTEMSEFVAKQALMQAGVSMLAQANQNPQRLLRLLE